MLCSAAQIQEIQRAPSEHKIRSKGIHISKGYKNWARPNKNVEESRPTLIQRIPILESHHNIIPSMALFAKNLFYRLRKASEMSV
jgi:hypothetical protein